MKKFLTSMMIAIGILMPSLAFPATSSAIDVFQNCDGNAARTDVCKDVNAQEGSNEDPIIGTLRLVLNIVSFVAGVAAVVTLILAGLRYVASGGDAGGIKSARDTLFYTLVGIAIIVAAQSIVAFVLTRI